MAISYIGQSWTGKNCSMIKGLCHYEPQVSLCISSVEHDMNGSHKLVWCNLTSILLELTIMESP